VSAGVRLAGSRKVLLDQTLKKGGGATRATVARDTATFPAAPRQRRNFETPNGMSIRAQKI